MPQKSGRPKMKRFVLHCAELGVYLGVMPECRRNDELRTCWAKPDAEDLDFAATFATAAEIEAHIATWDGPPPSDWRAVEVDADGAGHATLAACEAAGLPVATDEEDEGPVLFRPGAEGERRAGWAKGATVIKGEKSD